MDTFTSLITAAMSNPTAFNQAINNRAEDRVRPFYNPFTGVLPVQGRASYTASGMDITDAPAVLIPVGINSPYPTVGSVKTSAWKGETDKYALEVILDEHDLRTMREQMQAAQLNLIPGQTVADVAQSYFASQFVVRARRAAEQAEALAAARAVTSGKVDIKLGKVGVKLDFQLPNTLSRTGAQAYNKPGSTFWADDSTARDKLGIVTRVVTSRNTFNALVGQAGVTGITVDSIVNEVVGGVATGNFTATISRLTAKADGSYDLTSVYRDARYQAREIYVVAGTVEYVDANGDAVVEQLVEDGVIAYHGAQVLGYHHVGPTEEGNGAIGRYAWFYKPEGRAFSAAMAMVENHVPVLTQRKRMFVLKTSLN